MSADREGGNDDKYMSRLAPLGAASAAATRPNSPAPSHRSNLHPTNQAEEDEDMARALAMSTADLGGQETGVVGPTGGQKYFGPATKESYDTGQWAMVPLGSVAETTEVVPDLEAAKRKYVPGEPRLLKHLPAGDYTPNLLTICGAIDIVRQVLMMPQLVQDDYGQDAEWWKGHPIARPKIVHVDDGTAVEPESDKHDDLLAETQRLMAFFTASERSYASVGAMTQTEAIKDASPAMTRSRTLLELFLQKWCVAASSKATDTDNITRLFNTTVGTNAPEGMDTPDMSLIDMQVAIGEDGKAELFELLDGLLWDTDTDSAVMADNFIEVPAELLVMRVYQANPSLSSTLNVEVPAELYVDKYLEENVAGTRAIRTEMAKGKKRIEKIEAIEKKLKLWKLPNKNEHIEADLLLKHTLGHFNGENKANAAKKDRSYILTQDEENTEQPPHYQEIAQKLNKLIHDIDSKLLTLADEKEKTRKAIAEMSKAPPQGMEPSDLKHRYILRGVATKPNITYVLCPIDETTNHDEFMGEDKTPEGMRWWRIEYSDSSPPSLTKTEVGDFDVLRAVELEHHSALLVYASDLLTQPSANARYLPAPLQAFIDSDNALFATELQHESNIGLDNNYKTFDLTDVPRESIERGSMDSTRVEGLGGSDMGDDDRPPAYDTDPFYEHGDFGLPPDTRKEEEAPVHEIHLDDVDEGLGGEMVETGSGRMFQGAGGSGRMKDEKGRDIGW